MTCPTPPHTIPTRYPTPSPHLARSSLDVGLQLHRRFAAWLVGIPHAIVRGPTSSDVWRICGVFRSKPRSGDAIVAPHRARNERWCGVCVDSSHPRPRRGRTIREIRARGYGIDGPLRGPILYHSIHPTPSPHHRSFLARCGATIASPLRGLGLLACPVPTHTI